MIKKFEEYISEGFWKDGIRRAKTGEERLGEMLESNINELKPVDLLPSLNFCVADDLLFVEDKFQMDADEWKNPKILKLIKKYGWRIMNEGDLLSLENFKSEYDITKTGTKQRVVVNTIHSGTIAEEWSIVDIGTSLSDGKVHMHFPNTTLPLAIGDTDDRVGLLYFTNGSGFFEMEKVANYYRDKYPTSVWLVKDKE